MPAGGKSTFTLSVDTVTLSRLSEMPLPSAVIENIPVTRIAYPPAAALVVLDELPESWLASAVEGTCVCQPDTSIVGFLGMCLTNNAHAYVIERVNRW